MITLATTQPLTCMFSGNFGVLHVKTKLHRSKVQNKAATWKDFKACRSTR